MTPTHLRVANLPDANQASGAVRPSVWIPACVILLTPLTSNLPRGFPVPFFHLNEVILLAAFGWLVLQALVAGPDARIRLVRVSWLDPLFALLFLTGTLIPLGGYLLTGSPVVIGNAARFFDLIQFYMLYRILIVVVDDQKKLLTCALALVTAGVVIALLGMLEALNVLPVRHLIETYYPSYNLVRNIANGYPRVVSLLGSPQAYGAFLAISIFVCLTLLLYSAAEVPRRFVRAALLICFLGLVPSGAYSALIGTTLMFVLLLFFYRRLPYRAWGLGVVTLVIGAIIFAPQISARLRFQFRQPGSVLPETLLGRLEHWTIAVNLLAPSDLLFGFRGVLPPTLISFENQYIALLFRGGILFLFAYLYFIFRALTEAYTTFRRYEGIVKPIALCTFIVLIGFSVMALTDSYFTNSGVSEAIWTLVSLTAAGAYTSQPTHALPAGSPAH